MLPIQANKQTMSSREISELTGKEHGHVLRDIRSMISELKQDDPRMDDPQEEKDSRGYTSCIYLNRELTDTLLTGYSAVARRRVIKRWQELEAFKVHLPNFNNPVEAARAWADAKESENSAVLKLEAVKPQIEFHAAVTEAINAQSIEEVAKVLGTGRNRMFDWLRSVGLLKTDNLPYQDYIDRQYFRVIENAYKDKKGEAHTYTRTLITGKGLAYIQSRFMAEAA